MKKTARTTLTLILTLLVSFGLTAQEQSAADIVKKSIEALGGEAAVKNFKHYSAKGDIKMFNNTGKLKMTAMGKKLRTDISISFRGNTFAITQAYDGKIGWSERMGSVINQPSTNFESDLAHGISILLEKDAKFTLLKATELDGKKVLTVEAEYKGKKTNFYFDAETMLPAAQEWEDHYFNMQNVKELSKKKIRYANYKTFEGKQFPTEMSMTLKDRPMGEFILKEIDFNPQPAADFFTRPDEELDLRYREEMLH